MSPHKVLTTIIRKPHSSRRNEFFYQQHLSTELFQFAAPINFPCRERNFFTDLLLFADRSSE